MTLGRFDRKPTKLSPEKTLSEQGIKQPASVLTCIFVIFSCGRTRESRS